MGTLHCKLTEPPRTNSPQGDLQVRWFRIASCIGTSWRFAKEPRRFLCRFFVPLSSRRRKRQSPALAGAAGKYLSLLRRQLPQGGSHRPPCPPRLTPRNATVSQAQWRSKAVLCELATMVRIEKCRTQSRRLHKIFCFQKGRGKWQFVKDRKGTKAVPLPLLCASFFSQKKGQLPVFDGAAGKLPQSACAASPLKEGAKYSYKNSPSLLIQTGGAFKVLITAKVRLYPAWTVPPASRPDGRCGSSSRPASRQHTAHAAGHRQTAQ